MNIDHQILIKINLINTFKSRKFSILNLRFWQRVITLLMQLI